MNSSNFDNRGSLSNSLTEHEWNILLCANDFFASDIEHWLTALHNYGNVNVLAILGVERVFYSMTDWGICEAIENLKFLASIHNAIQKKCDRASTYDEFAFFQRVQHNIDDRGWRQNYAEQLARGFGDYYLLPQLATGSSLANAIRDQERLPLPQQRYTRGNYNAKYCYHCGSSNHIADYCPSSGVVRRVNGHMVSYGNKPRCFVCGTRNSTDNKFNFHSSENCPLRHPLSHIGVNRACEKCGFQLVRCWNCAIPACKNWKAKCSNANHRLNSCSRPRYKPSFGVGECVEFKEIKEKMEALGVMIIPRELRFRNVSENLTYNQQETDFVSMDQEYASSNVNNITTPADETCAVQNKITDLSKNEKYDIAERADILLAIENSLDIQDNMEICIICIGDINCCDYITLNCDHSYHEECFLRYRILAAKHLQDKCPICRRDKIDVVKHTKPIGVYSSAEELSTNKPQTSSSIWTDIVPTQGPFMFDHNYWTGSAIPEETSNNHCRRVQELGGRGGRRQRIHGNTFSEESQQRIAALSNRTSAATVGTSRIAENNTASNKKNAKNSALFKQILQQVLCILQTYSYATIKYGEADKLKRLGEFLAKHDVKFDEDMIRRVGAVLFCASQWNEFDIREAVIPPLLSSIPSNLMPDVMIEFHLMAENELAIEIGYANLRPFLNQHE